LRFTIEEKEAIILFRFFDYVLAAARPSIGRESVRTLKVLKNKFRKGHDIRLKPHHVSVAYAWIDGYLKESTALDSLSEAREILEAFLRRLRDEIGVKGEGTEATE
jgi:hypothetical protein